MFEAELFQDGSAALSHERRWFQRLPIAVQLELRARDLDMSVAIEPATDLDVIQWLEHESTSLHGRVITKHPHFGNGIEFIGVMAEAETQLRSFLEKAEHSRLI